MANSFNYGLQTRETPISRNAGWMGDHDWSKSFNSPGQMAANSSVAAGRNRDTAMEAAYGQFNNAMNAFSNTANFGLQGLTSAGNTGLSALTQNQRESFANTGEMATRGAESKQNSLNQQGALNQNAAMLKYQQAENAKDRRGQMAGGILSAGASLATNFFTGGLSGQIGGLTKTLAGLGGGKA